jgi:hypothetical protein
LKKLVEMQFGSHVYGTNTPQSDRDFKGLAIPSKRDIILQRAFRTINESTGNDRTKNTKDDIDREIFSLHHFMKLLTEGQTVCLDMLFTPPEFYTMPGHCDYLWTHLQNNQDKLVTKKMSAFAGYCQAQAAKYSLKGSNLSAYEAAMDFFGQYPVHKKVATTEYNLLINKFADAEVLNGKEMPLIHIVQIPNNKGHMEEYLQVGPKTKVPFNASCGIAYNIFKGQYDKYGERAKLAQSNQGVDWKALMHAVRVCQEAIELCKTGRITFPRPERDVLLKIRQGALAYQEVALMIEDGLVQLTEAKEKSSLPEAPDFKWIEDFVVDAYGQV